MFGCSMRLGLEGRLGIFSMDFCYYIGLSEVFGVGFV